MSVAVPHEVQVFTEAGWVVMHIEGAGTMKMPADAAHRLSRALMTSIAELDAGAIPKNNKARCPTCGR